MTVVFSKLNAFSMMPNGHKQAFTALIITDGTFERISGNYIEGTETQTPFSATVLPLTDSDLKVLGEGNFTELQHKIYCDVDLLNDTYVTQVLTGETWQINRLRGYDIIDGLFRYYLRKVEQSNG